MELTPIFRIEKFLDAIINSTTPPEPMFRVEYFLAKIGGADVVTPEPMFRIEKYLAKILGEDVEIPEPMFRTEFWLAKKCGEDVETPDPAFRVEYWLEEWCGGSAPTYETITGRIVSFITQRIAPLKIEATLEPIQDLHGYDNPWPPGGGVNKLDMSQVVLSSSQSLYGLTAAKNESTGEITISGTPTYSSTTAKQVNLFTYTDAYSNGYKCAYFLVSKSSNIDSVNANGIVSSNDAVAIVFKPNAASELSIVVKPVFYIGDTAPTTYAPYSNECPISGHSGAVVTRTGKNIWGGRKLADDIKTNVPAADIDELAKTITFTGNAIRNADVASGFFKPLTQYTIILYGRNASTTTKTSNLRFVYDDGTTSDPWQFPTLGADSTLVATSTAGKTVASVRGIFQSGTTVLHYDQCGIFEGVLTADEFEPYSGSSVTISFGSTVYGCTLTVNEDGTGTVKARPYYASYNGETLVGPWVSSMDAYAPGTTPTTGAQVVDMGGTETTITLSPGQVNALLGNNTVWVDDSGEIKVTFRSN